MLLNTSTIPPQLSYVKLLVKMINLITQELLLLLLMDLLLSLTLKKVKNIKVPLMLTILLGLFLIVLIVNGLQDFGKVLMLKTLLLCLKTLVSKHHYSLL